MQHFLDSYAACCEGHEDDGIEACERLRDACDKVNDGGTIFDEYGDEMTGKALTILEDVCEMFDSSLSGGAITGIVIACIVVVGGVAGALVFFLVIRKKSDSGGDGCDGEKAEA
jgi:hypothetical protein